MKQAWKGILIYFFSIKNAAFYVIFSSVGFIEICIGVFTVPARQILFLQGITFMQMGVLASAAFYIRQLLQSCIPLPVSTKTIFKVSFILIAALMGASAVISIGIIIVAGIISPVENFYAVILSFTAVFPVIFTARMLCTALSIKNKKIPIVISEVIFWGFFSICAVMINGWEGFKLIPALKPVTESINNAIRFFNTGSAAVVAVIGAVYLICIFLSFLWYKLSCKNFEKAQYSNYIKYIYR